MAPEESKEVKLDEEQERILTIKVSLEGPAELMAWMRERSPIRMGERLTRLFPSEFRRHVMAAQREQLLAVRSLLDAVIDRLGPQEMQPKRATKVDVE